MRVSGEDARTDEELAAAAARGDAAAFETLYFRYRDWVMGVAFRFAGEREAALDAVQETFAYLHRKLSSLKLEGRLTTLLYPAAKHAALTARRKRRLPREPAGIEPAAAAEDEGAGRYAELHAAVGRLPWAQREALLMRHVWGMAVAEIATALGAPVGTVKSRLHHAHAALADALGDGTSGPASHGRAIGSPREPDGSGA